jgi:hypothetical protein
MVRPEDALQNNAPQKHPSRPTPAVPDQPAPTQPSGDYTHGHPGTPPKDYEPPRHY